MSPRPLPTLAGIAAIAAVAATALTGAPPAAAEYKTITAQALAAHAEWLPYAPPPPNGPAAVCLVDTGVDLNPDTASNVIARIALDGGDPSDLSDSKHGTQMAMVMGAPMNDWGMVGFWPAVRIVSVRAPLDERGFLRSSGYRNGIESCLNRTATLGIAVVALALGSQDPLSEEDARRLDDEIHRAESMGIPIVAAAGNTNGGPVTTPADRPGVLGVGAIDRNGAPCSFSAVGPDVDVRAIGCGLDEASALDGSPLADGSGTSQAAVLAASLVATAKSYSQIEPSTLAGYLAEQGRPMNAADVFDRAGRPDVIDAGRAGLPAALRGAAAARPTRGQARDALPRPRLARIIHQGQFALVRVLNKPRTADLVVRRRGQRRPVLVTRRRVIRIRIDHRLVCLSYLRSIESRTRCLHLD